MIFIKAVSYGGPRTDAPGRDKSPNFSTSIAERVVESAFQLMIPLVCLITRISDKSAKSVSVIRVTVF